MNLIRPGDWLILLATAALIISLVQAKHGSADRLIIKQDGRVFLETSLRLDRLIDVPGPLGKTRVEIRQGRARVAEDPGPRQLCVKQGWLGAGEAAICLPNRVSVALGEAGYDSLNY